MTNNIFGPIITAKMVRVACMQHVQAWAPDYLAEVAEQDGRDRGDLPKFRSFSPMVNLDNFVEKQLPACVVIAPGTIAGQITKRVKGIDARWAVGVGAICTGRTEEETYELAELYAAAMRALFVQHPSMGGFSAGVTLLSERIQTLDSNGSRTLMAGIIQLGVDVNSIVDPAYGPVEPSVDPTAEPPDWPTIETVEEQVLAGVDGV